MGNDQESGPGKGITADNESDETPESSTASYPSHLDVGALLPSHMDLVNPSFLGDSPLDLSGPFMAHEFDYASISEGIDLDLWMSNPDDFLVGITSGHGKPPTAAPDLSRARLPNTKVSPSPAQCGDQGKEHGAEREIKVSVDDANNDCAEALYNLAKYPAEITASFRFPSKHATRRFVSAFFRHIAPHIPIVHEPTFEITTVPCKLQIFITLDRLICLEA